MTIRTRSIATALAALLATSLIACDDIGEAGNFSFGDETEYGEWDLFNGTLSPLAVGAVMQVEVQEYTSGSSDPEQEPPSVSLSSATSGDPSIFTVDGFDGAMITVTGVAAGSAFLEVEATDGTTDRVEVTVDEPADFEVTASTGQPLIDGFGEPEIWALRRGIEVPMSARARSADNRPMTGVGAEMWSISVDDGEAMTPGNGTDGWDIVQTANGHADVVVGDVGDAVSVSGGGSSAFLFDVVGDDAITSIEITPWVTNPADGTVPVGNSLVFSISATTDDGTYVLGRDGFTVVLEGDDGVAQIDAENEELGEYASGLHGSFVLNGLAEGATEVVVNFGQLDHRVSVTVTAATEGGDDDGES